MSLVAPKNCNESVNQYCNYGYDKTKYSSVADCLSKEIAKCSSSERDLATARDPWSGGVEWDKVFSLKNLFWLVVLVYLAYLFMKHVLPLAKKSFS